MLVFLWKHLNNVNKKIPSDKWLLLIIEFYTLHL